MAVEPCITVSELAEFFARHCPDHNIDLASAVALPCRLPHAEAWRAWIASDRHADLDYMTRDVAARADPTRVNRWARSALVFAQRYADGWPPPDCRDGRAAGSKPAWLDGVALYARGGDYHELLLQDIRAVTAALVREVSAVRTRIAVDTGPYLERELAWLAGLGFFGKNSCLIHERLGSGLFLGVALTGLRIDGLPPPGNPAVEPVWAACARTAASRTAVAPAGGASGDAGSRCGRCRRCLEACPTGALVEPFVLDARLCISTWTIEWRGRAPRELRHRQSAQLFGCDICQTVCPWNHKAARRGERRLPDRPRQDLPCEPRAEYGICESHRDMTLRDLLSVGTEAFGRRFRRTPLWRAHPEGMRRNALVVAANTGRRDLGDEIERLAAEDPDAEVREVAQWSLRALREGKP